MQAVGSIIHRPGPRYVSPLLHEGKDNPWVTDVSPLCKDILRMKHPIRVTACSQTDPGLKRPRNEDVCMADINRGILMVADGMGGVAGGEVASALFLGAVNETFNGRNAFTEKAAKALIETAYHAANRKILEHAAATPAHRGLGCTAELLTVCADSIVFGHVGDSRTYGYRDGRLAQLTLDHSMVQEQVALGIMTQEQANTSRLRNILTRAVGIHPQLSVDISSREIRPGDIYLLATDGLHGMVDDAEIMAILAFDAPISLKADMLIHIAINAGGRDNVSVALMEVLR